MNENDIKNNIINKWKKIDSKYKEPKYFICRVCKCKNHIHDMKKIVANCSFGGGILNRYKCSNCGVIFGPLKFMELSQLDMIKDYIDVYKIFSEGNTYNNEISAFHLLKPNKNKIYLDVGCGSNSKVVANLNKNGYNVFGYDYLSSNGNKIINNVSDLLKYKFDGIFSNNTIEHVIDPINEFLFYKNILKNDGLMVHCTPCYKYCYEKSRFHVHFFVDDSINYLCKNTGFNIINKIDDGVIIKWIFSVH